jgi:penicillin-binding protein 2
LWKRQNKPRTGRQATPTSSRSARASTATPLRVVGLRGIANNGVTAYRTQVTDADSNVIQRFTPKARARCCQPENLAVVKKGWMPWSIRIRAQARRRVWMACVAGKTGTAEYCDDMALKNGDCYVGHQPTHAWFAAYAPVEDPEIAVLVFIYNGGEGSRRRARGPEDFAILL